MIRNISPPGAAICKLPVFVAPFCLLLLPQRDKVSDEGCPAEVGPESGGRDLEFASFFT